MASTATLAVLADAAIKGAVIILLAAAASLLLRRGSAALRHALWTTAIVAQLALPLLAFLLPAWRVPLAWAPSWLAPTSTATSSPAPTPEVPTSTAIVSSAREPVTAAPSAPTAPRDAGTPPASPAPATPTPAAPSASHLLFLIWAAGAALILLGLSAGTFGVWRLARRGRRVLDGRWLSLAQRLAERLGISRPITLMRGDSLGVPVTWGIVYPVVLLPPDADRWDGEQRRYVLVHEMAHVRRLDALTHLVAQLAVAIFWFDPLVWFTAARMRAEREHACDDYVLRDGTRPSRYADDLLTMVRTLGAPAHRRAQPAFAALAMARRSELEGRMLSILDTHLNRGPLGRRGMLMLTTTVLLLTIPLAAFRPLPGRTPAPRVSSVPPAVTSARPAHPAPSATAATDSAAAAKPATSSTVQRCAAFDPDASSTSSSTRINEVDNDGAGTRVLEYLVTSPGRCAEANLAGQVTFSDDDRSVVRLGPGAYATFSERRRGFDREARFTHAPDGGISMQGYVDGHPTQDESAVRAWLADLLPEVLSEAAINVPQRVARLRAQGGVDRVLAMIRGLRSSGAKRAHYEALLDGPLNDTEMEHLVRDVGTTLKGSSGDLRAVLERVSRHRVSSPATRAALGAAVTEIPSSGDKRAALETLAPTADREMLLIIARSAKTIPSSGDKANFLTETAAQYLEPRDAELHAAWFDVASTVPSSGDLSTVLEAALFYGHDAPDVTAGVIETSKLVSSDGDRAAVLIAVASQRLLTSTALRSAFAKAAGTIRSSGDYRRVVEAAALLPQ